MEIRRCEQQHVGGQITEMSQPSLCHLFLLSAPTLKPADASVVMLRVHLISINLDTGSVAFVSHTLHQLCHFVVNLLKQKR